MDRRRFVKLCAGSATLLASGVPAALADDFTDFPTVRLTDAKGIPLKASALTDKEAYVFHYPYPSLPCFLINLNKSVPTPGGVGKGNNIVAYVAVCSHQLSFPEKELSVIRYAAKKSEFAGASGMIVCCSHGSVFDPAAGAKRLRGESSDPLVAVRLKHDPSNDGLYATGLSSMPVVERFYTINKRRFIEEYGPGVYREPVGNTSPTILLSKHTSLISSC
jgi:Rieske Fe-S protein